MRKTCLALFLAVVGAAFSSQAVVISWASEALLTGTASASLVYVASGVRSDVLLSGTTVGTASGYAIDGSLLYEQTTTTAAQSEGAYYVVIYNSGNAVIGISAESLAYNDSRISTSEMDPPGTFLVTFPVPEPVTLAFLCVGAAAVALKRGKRA